jgi:hypothetical protein
MHCKLEKNLLGSIIAFLSLVSCAARPTTVPPSPFAPVYVTDRARFTLLPAAEIEQALDGPQQFSGTFGNQEFIMEAWVKADKTGIAMALYNSLGTDMGNFSFSDEKVSFQSPVFPPAFKAEYLAADFQFCFFRPSALREALEKCGLVFEFLGGTGENGEYDGVSHPEIRRISDGKKIIIEIEKTENQVRYQNFLRGYTYTLAGALR